jgi:hypothetical protein
MIVVAHGNALKEKLEPDTVYYLERFVRRFVLVDRQAIRESRSLKPQLTAVLDFLIEQGSVVAYMVRESII